MKFMLTFSFKPEVKVRDEAIARFKKTGGAPPKGVKLLGRWTHADLGGGCDLLECDDVIALGEFAYMWSNLMDLTITPVVEDEVLNEILKRART
jgi:hypothetical protein